MEQRGIPIKRHLSNLTAQLMQISIDDNPADSSSQDDNQSMQADSVPPLSLLASPQPMQQSLASPSSSSVLSFTTSFINNLQYPTCLVRYSDLGLIHCNESAFHLFGYDNVELEGLRLSDLFPGIRKRFCRQAVSNSSSSATTTPSVSASLSAKPRYSSSFDERRASVPAWTSSASYHPSSAHVRPSSSTRRNQSVSFAGTAAPSSSSSGGVSQLIKARLHDGSYAWVELSLSEISHMAFVGLPSSSSSSASSTVANASGSVDDRERYLLATVRELSRRERLSRYRSEFDEIGVLGRGGYGVVYRARNKIDGQEYAIKKIRLDSHDYDESGNRDKFIREVQTFARISNHPNVVRYYAAWTEAVLDDEGNASKEEEDDCLHETSFGNSLDSCDVVEVADDRGLSDIEFLAHDDTASEDNNGAVEVTVGSHKSSQIKLKSSRRGKKRTLSHLSGSVSTLTPPLPESVLHQQELLSGHVDQMSNSHSQKPSSGETTKSSAILYIQMQLCPFNDLRRWIDRRGTVTSITDNIHILQQIVEGVNHIHQKGFVHRDIKPENLFIQDDHVYLGDFGLAKSIVNKVVAMPDTSSERELHQDHSGGVGSSQAGTYLYSAPESFVSNRASGKSDIFSLAIVMIELFIPFSTGMERAVVLSHARQGILPAELDAYPKQKALIAKMLSLEPRLRPTTREILQIIESWTDNVSPEIFATDLALSSSSMSTCSANPASLRASFRSNGPFNGLASSTNSPLATNSPSASKSLGRRWSSIDTSLSTTMSEPMKIDTSSVAIRPFYPAAADPLTAPPIFSTPIPSPMRADYSPMPSFSMSPSPLKQQQKHDENDEKIKQLEKQVAELTKQMTEMRDSIQRKDALIAQLGHPPQHGTPPLPLKRSSLGSKSGSVHNSLTLLSIPSVAGAHAETSVAHAIHSHSRFST